MNVATLQTMRAQLEKLRPLRFVYKPGAAPRKLYAEDFDKLQREFNACALELAASAPAAWQYRGRALPSDPWSQWLPVRDAWHLARLREAPEVYELRALYA